VPNSAHRLAEERSLALHEEIAARIRENPEIAERARERVRGWLYDGSVHHEYAERWSNLLARPIEQIAEAIVRRDQEAHDLRQVSPFAGTLDPRTRWRIRREALSRVGK
jgi:hypothetical protein